MNLRNGLIAAILIAFAVYSVPRDPSAWHWNSPDPGDSVTVLVADRYIPAFTVIKPNLVRLQEFPKVLVPPGALHHREELQNSNGQWLFTAMIAIPQGQAVTRAFLTDAAQSDTLGSLIRPGKVAVSFEVDKSHGVGGWIRPGDNVALFGPEGQKKTKLLLPSVPVLAVDARRLGQGQEKTAEGGGQTADIPDAPPAESRVLTVLVNPAEASLLMEAREEGSLSVVLRSLGDDVLWPAR